MSRYEQSLSTILVDQGEETDWTIKLRVGSPTDIPLNCFRPVGILDQLIESIRAQVE